jgi:hypothetical protein
MGDRSKLDPSIMAEGVLPGPPLSNANNPLVCRLNRHEPAIRLISPIDSRTKWHGEE